MAISVRNVQQHLGGNHSAIIYRDVNGVELGLAVYDPARNQFCFRPFDNDVVLSSAEITAIVAILNSLSK